MAKVSIILPCYKVEKFIAKCIDSVLAQTYTNFELLVVIDGSPDKSKQIAEEYAKKDARIRVYEKPNGGLSDARNYGMERAQGDFIYFMDSDDWIEPDLIKDNLNIVDEENLDFIVFGYVQDNQDVEGNIISSKSITPLVEVYHKSDKNLTIDLYHVGLLGYAWNKLYRKSFLDKHKFRFINGISLVEDILFNAPIYMESNKIWFNKKAYYHYVQREEETLTKVFHKNSFELKKMRFVSIEKFLNTWKVNGAKELLAQIHTGGIRYCIHNLLSYENQFHKKKKLAYIYHMFNDHITRNAIKYYRPKTRKDAIYKYLIKYKMVKLTYYIAKNKL